MEIDLENEANSIEKLLSSKSISRIFRPRKSEICIELSDGTRFFIQSSSDDKLEFSITSGSHG